MLLEKSIYCNEEILKEYLVIRIKILDIYEQKVRGNLKGCTPKEQYDYYEKTYLNNATYVKSLLQEYPELKRLLELKNNSTQRAECEIRKSLYAEKEQIQKMFWPDNAAVLTSRAEISMYLIFFIIKTPVLYLLMTG